jgi:PHD/YefM family antitoxin component YafN of YafNO toxin-antitoxin module
MKNSDIVDLLPLHKQMTLVIFRDSDTRKYEVQILPVSLEAIEPKVLQEMLEILVKPGTDAATVPVVVEESLSRAVLNWCEERGITSEQLIRSFTGFCGEPENTDVLKAWIKQEIARERINIERLPSVTREEWEQNVDVIMERVEGGESPILILNAGKADALLFSWEDYWRRFSTLHTPEELAEIEAACLEMKEADNT